ncbi:PREDICTED: protocadherin gamma-A10-like [Condylura cristata]|uniref:protocadherin gamma-A10-like n=1 Tax=Condylura cristata TaxID=143302 RepID=UPI00064300F7|nr:PREDICTED: protocadherin gamma-A10-like [Condylura cristata]
MLVRIKNQLLEMLYSTPGDPGDRNLLLVIIIIAAWEAGSGQIHYSVPEEAKHGTFVGRIAQDLGLELADLVPRLFRVASKGRGDLLEVNLQNGILFVNSRIDREELCGRSAECSLHLEVIVDRPLQVFHVEVEVKDINDNSPVFPATQKNLFMAESRPLDSRFPLEGASDADIGENAQLTYRLSPNEYFSLDVPTNHEQVKPLGLLLRKPLDREESPELHLTLTATDGGKPELTGTVQVLVKVLDANDNAPVFDKALYAVKLPENAPNGTLVIKLNASDLDEGLNGDIIYSFSSDVSPDVKSRFYIDPISGRITVIGLIDFEESKAYKIRVEAIDKGALPLAGHCTVLVEVLDANDNAPELTVTSLSLPISEDAQPGTVITLINVFDRDSGADGQVTCSLTPQVPFKLVSTFKNYYSLVLDKALDRENISNYKLVRRPRVCSGEGPPKADLMAFSPCQPPGPVSADNVSSKRGLEMTFSWRGDPRCQCLLLSLLLLPAWEAGSGQVRYSVPEEAKHGTFVGRIAQDLGLELADLVPRLFRQRRPRVCSGEGPPKADLMAFSPSLPPGPSSAESPEYRVGSRFLLLSFLLLSVWEVESGQVRYSVPEEAKHGTFVGRIAQDLGLELQRRPRVCSGEGPPKADLMAFSPSLPPGPSSADAMEVPQAPLDSSGKVDLNYSDKIGCKKWNRKICLFHIAVYQFVKQEKGMMLIYRLSVHRAWCLLLSLLLLSAWEAGSGQVRYSVPEEAKHGTFVGRIAQDLGLELADLVPRLFRVASKGRGDLLEVNLQNGILFVNSRIDREELCGRSAECSLHLEVIVDRPLQVFHVEVEVKDINDNPPVFSVSEQKLSIPESRLLDSRFPLEGAADADVGENAMLTYRLSPNEFFILDTVNKKDKGKFPVLVLRKLLDREENPQFQLLLTATDGGKPELTGSVTLLILVLDANDNAPIFDRSVYEVKLYENSANQTVVICLNASDADEGTNKEMIYSFSSLVPPSVRRKFLMNDMTGEIKVNDVIDFEDSNSYEIHVDVADKGNPPMVGHCTVLVEILDENDNSPQVFVTTLALPVPEDAQVGTVIALIRVSDRDSGTNGKVTCSLTPNVPFKLVSTFKNHYSLLLASALDRESVSNYALVVTARDGGSPPLSATASVSVEVADVNDNAPAFAQPEYTVFTTLMNFIAIDNS